MDYIACPDCKTSIPVNKDLDDNESLEVMCSGCLLDLVVTKKSGQLEVKPGTLDKAYSDDNYGAFD